MICPCLNMKMKRERRPKKTTTLSIVLSMTTSCLWSPGKNLTSLSILNNLNVLRTVRPEPSSFIPNNRPLIISTPLNKVKIIFSSSYDKKLVPKADKKAIKNIEAVTDVLDKAKCCNFHQHFDRENETENKVAGFHHFWKCFWLIMVLNTHAAKIV